MNNKLIINNKGIKFKWIWTSDIFLYRGVFNGTFIASAKLIDLKG